MRAILAFLFLFHHISAVSHAEDEMKKSIVQIKISVQSPNFMYPWQLKKPSSFEAVGVAVEKGKILTLAVNLDYATSIEIKKHSSYVTEKAVVERIDYESNLAVLSVSNESFFSDLIPVKFENRPGTDISGSIVQLDNSGTIQTAVGRITAIDSEMYPLGQTEFPFLSINSNEKLEGNGELILHKKKIQGILYKFTPGKSTGKAVPGFLINKFLSSKTKGKSSVFPHKGFKFKGITDNSTKEYFGLDKNREGVIVSEIIPYSSADGVLETEDVITEFGGKKIDSQGFFQHPEYGKVQLSFLAHSGDEFGFKKGKKLPVKILRDRKEMTVNLVLKSFPYKSIRIPYLHNFGKHPSYLIRGGFVFTELSELLLREWGQNWRSRVDKKLLYYMDYKKHHETRESHGKVVIMVQVLPDESNNGYHSLSMDIVTLAGDMKVSSIKELDTVISRTETPYIPIQLDNGVTIVLDKAGLKQTDENISKKFHIPVLSSIQ